MKAVWLAAGVLAGAFGAAHVQAKEVTVEFSIPVASLWVEDFEWGTFDSYHVQTYTIGGMTISTGDTLHGSFRYDDAAVLDDGATRDVQFTMSFPGRTFQLTNTSLGVWQGAGAPADVVAASGYAYESDISIAVGVGFVAPDGQLAPDSLPSADAWQYFTGGVEGTHFALTVKNPASPDPNAFHALYIDEGSFIPHSVSAVPEPATAGMLLAGLALVGTAARRRRILSAA